MDLFELLKNGTTQIIDVRTESEFQSGHVKNSKNIPVDKVPNLLDEFKSIPKHRPLLARHPFPMHPRPNQPRPQRRPECFQATIRRPPDGR